jgi:hypothetical protein
VGHKCAPARQARRQPDAASSASCSG